MMQKHHVITVTMFRMRSVITMTELPGVNYFFLEITQNQHKFHRDSYFCQN